MNWKEYTESNRVMLCQDCLRIAPFDLAGHQEDYTCTCGGQWCGCLGCNNDAKRLISGERSKAVFGGTSDVSDTWTPDVGIRLADDSNQLTAVRDAEIKSQHFNQEQQMGKTFTFELGTSVKISASGETGAIIGRAEYSHAEDNYLLRYKAADGRAVESWWAESAIEAA